MVGTPDPVPFSEVRSPSGRAETGVVLRVAFHIVFWSGLVIAAGRAAQPPVDEGALMATSSLQPGEVAFQDLSVDEQRIFRQLQEGLVEAENVRSARKLWPEPAELAEAAIPPFAPDPIDKVRYTWTRLAKGPLVNYVGVPPVGSDRRGFVAIITEPDPGAPVDPQAATDEVHHRLGDGTFIHVFVWIGPPLRDRQEPVGQVAPEEGYRHVVAGTHPGN